MISQGNGGALLAISSPHAFIAGACPILVGRLFQTTENWNLILLLFAGVFLLGAICWLFVNPQTGIRLAERELCAT
jgi:ACS family glucarate transporter-like MFS transporter/ACS family D-galactonate transporter-like MFS transporter